MVAMDLGRGGHKEQRHILAVLPGELTSLGIHPGQAGGTTACYHSDKRHYDILVGDDAIGQLVHLLRTNARTLGKYTKGKVKAAYLLSAADGCHALPKSQGDCRCLRE